MTEGYKPWIEYQEEGQDITDRVILPEDLVEDLFSGTAELSRKDEGLRTLEHHSLRDDV